MKKLYKVFSLAMAMLMALSLVACGGGDSSGSGGSTSAGGDGKKKDFRFAVIYTANNSFWDSVGQGAYDKAKELTDSGEYNVEIYAAGPATTGVAGQMQLFEDIMSQGYDGIIISCSDSTAMKPVIDAAYEKGVPVVCMDTEVADSKRLCFVGTDNYNFGCMLAEEVVRILDGKGKVLIETLDPTMTAMAERLAGTQDTFAKYPDIEVLEVMADIDMSQTMANIENLVAKYSDFDCLCMNYVGGENIINVWKANGWTAEDKHAVVSDDIDPIILGVKEGIIDSTIVQGQYNWGYVGVQVLVDYLANGIVPDEFVETSAYACDKEMAEKNYPNVVPVE